MAKIKTLDHPEGTQDCVVTDHRRGRWMCRDYVEKDADEKDAEERSNCQENEDIQQNNAVETNTALRDNVEPADDKPTDAAPVPSTSDLDGRYQEEFPVVTLDSNFNASPTRPKSRTTKTELTGAGTRKGADELRWVTSGDLVVVLALTGLVLFPYLALSSPSVGESWQLLHTVWKVVVQGVVALLTIGLVLLVLQVHFSSYRLRQWIAWFFQLQLKEEPDASSLPPLPQSLLQAHDPGDGDKVALMAGTTITNQQCCCGVGRLVENCTQHALDSCTQHTMDSCNQHILDSCTQQVLDKQMENCPQQILDANSNQTEEEVVVPHTDKSTQIGEQAGLHTDRKASQGKRYRKALKDLRRKFLLIRRKYKTEMSGLQRTDQEAGQMLSRIQLALPVLEREKQALLAELEAIQKQHQEERRRNQDLLLRLQRLNQQFVKIGISHHSSSASKGHRQP